MTSDDDFSRYKGFETFESILFICLGLLILVLLVCSNRVEGEELSAEEPSGIFIEDDITINVVFAGLDPGDDDLVAIEQGVTDWYVPWVFFPDCPIGVEYAIDLNLIRAPGQFAIDLADYNNDSLYSITKVGDYKNRSQSGYYLDHYWDMFYGEDDYSDQPVYNMDARKTEKWLKNNTETYPGLEGILDDYTLFILFPEYTMGGETSYYYSINGTDVDTGKSFSANNLNAFGGNYNFFFMDWWAWPPNFGDAYGASNETMADLDGYSPYWNSLVTGNQDFIGSASGYINEAIEFLFLHSYVYQPVYETKYELDLLVLDCTSDDSFFDVAHEYINVDFTKEELKDLIPYADWTFELLKGDVDDFPDISNILNTTSEEQGDAVIIDSDALLPACDEQIIFPEGYVTIPCFIFIFDDAGYVDRYYKMGGAESIDGENPWGIIIASGMEKMEDFGLTNTVIHEVGHILGLMHPHHNSAMGEFQDGVSESWLYDFSATVMGYNAAMCNNEYSVFDYDVIDRGHCLDLLNSTRQLWYETNLTLLEKHYSWDVLPTHIRGNIGFLKENFTGSITEFREENYFDLDEGTNDSWSFALQAYELANETYHMVENISRYNRPPGIDLVSPANGSLDVPLSSSLVWQGSDADPWDELRYSLYFGTDSEENMTLMAEDLTASSYENILYHNFLFNRTCYWRVAVTDGMETRLSDTGYFSTESWPDDMRMALIVSSPANHSTVSGTLTIVGKAACRDANEAIEHIEVSVNGEDWEKVSGTTSWSFLWDTNDLDDGGYGLTFRAFDGIEFSGIVEIEVDVLNFVEITRPVVSIYSPAIGVHVSGMVTISGSAHHPGANGTVEKVELSLSGGEWVTINGTTTWEYQWDSTEVKNGMTEIRLRAYDGEVYSRIVVRNLNVMNIDDTEKPSDDDDDSPGFDAALLVLAVTFVYVFHRKSSGRGP